MASLRGFALFRWGKLEIISFFGAVAVGIVTGSLWETGKVLGAPWWEALTAIGTVAAVMLALVFGLKEEIEKAFTKKYRNKFISAKINDRISAYLLNLDHVIRAAYGMERINRMAMLRLTRLWWIEDITDTDVIELSGFYRDAYQLIQVRERILFLMRIGNVPRECLRSDVPYYWKFYRNLKAAGEHQSLVDIRNTLSMIQALTKSH